MLFICGPHAWNGSKIQDPYSRCDIYREEQLRLSAQEDACAVLGEVQSFRETVEVHINAEYGRVGNNASSMDIQKIFKNIQELYVNRFRNNPLYAQIENEVTVKDLLE